MRSLNALVILNLLLISVRTRAEDAPAKGAQAPVPSKETSSRETSQKETSQKEISPPAEKGPAPAVKPGQALETVKRVSDPQAVAIVESYLKAIGGKEVLSKIKDRTTLFTNTKSQATGETKVEINLLMKDDIMIREEWDVKGFDIKGEKLAFVQIYNGVQEEGWVQMLGTVSPLDGRTLQVFVWDKYMDDFFCHLEDDGFTVTMAGQGLVSKEILGEEHPCDIVLVTDFLGRQGQRYFFSKKNNLLLKKEWQDEGPNPKTKVKKEQYYKLYRDLPFMDGSGLAVKFPLRIEIYVDGDLDTERAYTNVRFNSGLSDKLFDKPEGRPFEGAVKESPKTADPVNTTGSPAAGSSPKAKPLAPTKVAPPTGPPSGTPGGPDEKSALPVEKK